MNNGRGWNRNGGGGWNRSMRFAGPPPPLFRGGMNFIPRGPVNFFPPVGPPMWRGGMSGGRRGARGGGPPAFGGRGGVNKRPGKFGPMVMLKNNKQWKNSSKEKKNRKDTVGKRLSEDEIGVTEYISDHSGFNGIIKSRYADFQVSEIDEKGEIAKLTDQKIPEPPKKDEINDDEDLLLSKYNLELLPTDVWDQINSISVDPKLTMTKVEVDVTGMSKEHRTKVHDAVKKAFGDSIVGSTVTTNDKKLIRFERYRKGVRIDKRVKWMWPGEFVHFIVHKENCDTMEAASRIAERLNLPFIKPTTLGYSGTKDRRAKSSQWFSLRKVEPRIIAMACKDFRDIHVGNFRFSETHLKLGMLKGNRFRIALRNVQCEEEVIEKACHSLQENGFINYYGLQRFGTRSDTPTYSIGLKLLQGNIQEAIDSILEVRPGPLYAGLKMYKDTRSAAQAYKLLKRYSVKLAEGRLLRALSKEPNNLLGALNKLPRNTRLLYGHSYQSLIWNKCVSERIRRFDLQPSVGDLVLADPSESKLEDSNDAEHTLEEDSDDENTDGPQAENSEDKPAPEAKQAESQEKDTAATESNGEKKEKPKTPVKVLTEEDIVSGRYSIWDVIMPLPGHNIDYPPNMKDYYEKLLTEDRIPLDMKHKIRCFSMSGAYRFVVVRPDNLSWRCVRYTNPFGDLILSDHDELTGKTLNSIVDDGKFKALLLDMSLPSSCYATMALRELLRVDTSGDNQAQQNDYHREGEEEVKAEEKNGIKTEEEDAVKTEEEDAVKTEEENAMKTEEEEDAVKTEEEDGVKTEEGEGEDGAEGKRTEDGAEGKRKLEEDEASGPKESKKVKTQE